MPLAADVRLPKSHSPQFPPRCPGCGDAASVTASVKLTTNAIGWLSVLSRLPGARFTATVPMCDACATRHRRQRRIRMLVELASIAAAGAGAFVIVERYHGPFKKWIFAAVTIALLLPLIGWQIFNPTAVDITAYADSVDYEFADADYAAEFAELNGGTVS